MQRNYFSFTKTFFVLIAGFCMQQGLAQDAMFIAPSGNVGIGTSSPRGVFDVSPQGDIYLVKDPNKALNQSLFLPGHIYIAPHWDSDNSYLQARRKDDSGSTNLIFRTSNNGKLNDIMVLAASGNIGIGTASPANKFSVEGNANFTGNVGIGTSSPTSALDVKGNIVTRISDESNVHSSNNRGTTKIGMMSGTTEFAGIDITTEAWDCGNGGKINFMTWGCNYGSSHAVVTINQAGNLGIGTTNPTEAKLVVKGSVGRTIPLITGYAYKDSWQGGGGGGLSSISIYTENTILSASFFAFSDSRIKTDFHRSDIAADLATLKQIQVTDYRYKDGFQYGNAMKKGIIAQEVEAVFPQAVNKHTDYITDIFAMPKAVSLNEKTLTVSMEKAHGLANGDMLRLITPTEVVETAVEVLDNNTFMVKDWAKESKEVFVYGKKVDDFRAVDFDRLTILSISSIQQLCKEMEAMKAENAAYKKALLSLEARMDRVEENVKPASAAIR